MAELPLPQYYREKALRLRQMAAAASSPVSRLEYGELATYYEKLAEDVEHFIEQRRRKSAWFPWAAALNSKLDNRRK
jgi:hypothetical protein